MARYDESFTNSILENGVSPGPMLRYEQERLLFGFFNSGCSAVDAFFFGMFTIGAMLDPVAFRLRDNSDERDVTPANCCRAYCKAFTGDPIVSALQLATNNRDSDWEKFSAIRNVLTHRAAPPRDFFVGDPSQPDAIMFELTSISTRRRPRLVGHKSPGYWESFSPLAIPLCRLIASHQSDACRS
jgi:hypothetical protein